MGRPRVHDDHTARILLDAAERLVAEDGLEALSVRRVASAVGATTRAVYSLFGSKEGLLVALGNRAFEILGAGIRALPARRDPVADLVEVGVVVFRRFALDHQPLFRIAFERHAISKDLAVQFRPTRMDSLAVLEQRISRLSRDRIGGKHAVSNETIAFHALCEGLAALELRGSLPTGREKRVWRHAFAALLTGLARRTEQKRRT